VKLLVGLGLAAETARGREIIKIILPNDRRFSPYFP
jgi:hypothetical protein